MKIEKINDHQIRCTLSREDLADRQIKLSELAYGSDKTKMLFRDMMQKAANDFGFEAGDFPLMIEAIPLSSDTIVLIISKVDNPDELDTRFSRFTEDANSEESASDAENSDSPDLMNLIGRLRESGGPETGKSGKKKKSGKKDRHKNTGSSGGDSTSDGDSKCRIFTSADLDTIITLSRSLKGYYNSANTLYKNPVQGIYYLLLSQGEHTSKEFNRISHLISEYMETVSYLPQTAAYLDEHLQVICRNNALQILSSL